ncbi:MAG: putative amidohydrolase [Bacteroidetes bacterium]|nr:MAG: putative amidohydrolase [Bacteroidota bacterium]
MKICIAQTEPIKGNVSANIEAHKRFIELALTLHAEAIFFPELSLTGYEPELAKKLATNQNDERLDIFQETSDNNNIIIGLGLPTASESHIRISMIIFEPNQPRQTYSKQQLHSDEFPYFEQGVGQVIIKANDTHIAPAICYESLQPAHAENAFKLGADVYLASVAKPENGVEKAFKHYPAVAKQYAMPVLMSNCVGFCDNFLSVGKSAVWTKEGELVGQLDDKTEGILIFDTETEEIVKRTVINN